MIEINNLTKVFEFKKKGRGFFGNLFFPRYGTYSALKNVSFDVREGEILGLLGPNGAGKTTVIKVLMGLLRPTSGSALIMGKPAEKQQSRIGLFFGHTTMTYHRITGYDNLKYYGALYGVKDVDSKIDALSRQFRLKKWLDEFVEHYSKGMKIKLSLARALMHDPDVLLLDEPTLGLDARASEYITSKLPKLKKTILYTTHYIEEAKKLSDRVVVLKNGKVTKVFSRPANADIKREMMK